MAKVLNNIVTQGLSGRLGNQIVFRAGKGGQTIVSAKPSFNGYAFNATQLEQQEAFRNAILYAKSAKDEAVYVAKAQGTVMNPFNVAVADWFSEPEVLEIDTGGWTGNSGQSIRVKAQDDTFVSKVHVAILNASNAILEQGEAVQLEGLWWSYTTQMTQAGGIANLHLVATVTDLPGHTHQLTWQGS